MSGSNSDTLYDYPFIFEGVMNISSVWKMMFYINYKESHNASVFKFSSCVTKTYVLKGTNEDSLLNSEK